MTPNCGNLCHSLPSHYFWTSKLNLWPALDANLYFGLKNTLMQVLEILIGLLWLLHLHLSKFDYPLESGGHGGAILYIWLLNAVHDKCGLPKSQITLCSGLFHCLRGNI